MKKCFFALVLPLALLLTACGREPRPAALLLGQAADLDESETLLVIDGQSIPAWEYLYWLALDCRQMEERCEAAGEPVDWTAPLSDGGTTGGSGKGPTRWWTQPCMLPWGPGRRHTAAR